MDDVKKALLDRYRRLVSKKPNPNIHSELHAIVDDLRMEYGEDTIKSGVGSFGWYLGRLKGMKPETVRRIASEVRQSETCRNRRKLFFYLIKQWKIRMSVKRAASPSSEPSPTA